MAHLTDHVVFRKPSLSKQFANKLIPIDTLFEAYFDAESFDLASRDLDGDALEPVLQDLAHPDLLLPIGGSVSALSDGRPPLRMETVCPSPIDEAVVKNTTRDLDPTDHLQYRRDGPLPW